MASTDAARWYVISLRPQGGHAALRRAAARHGAGLLALSPWRIDMTDDDATRAALDAALRADRVLFTSPAAVRAAKRLARLAILPGQIWLAVGEGTAAALRRAGIAEVVAPSRMDSEGVLALPCLNDVQGLGVGLVTAPDGRGLIAPALQARGARLRRADVYRRLPAAIPARAFDRLAQRQAPTVLLLSSGAALDGLLAQAPPHLQPVLRQLPVIAASERLARQAAVHGFLHIHRARGPRPAQLLDAAAAAVGALRLASDPKPQRSQG